MGDIYPFSGSALVAVDNDGRLRLPASIRNVIERRGDGTTLLVGLHEAYPCLTAYDQGHARHVHAESERRRLRDEADGSPLQEHYTRVHRAFGIVEEAAFDDMGEFLLPPMMRRLGRIEDLVLFVGGGGSFEMWNPQLAVESDDDLLRELAGYRLANRVAN